MKKLVTRWGIFSCEIFAQVYGTRYWSCKESVQRLKKKIGNRVQVCLLSTVSAHILNLRVTAFIMPIDFNYCPSDLAQWACFQPVEPKKSSFAAKPRKSWPHSSILCQTLVPCFLGFFFRPLSGLGWLPSLDFPSFGEGHGSAVTPGQSERLSSHR